MDDIKEVVYEVYAKTDEKSRVLAIDGGVTMCNVDPETWVKIDEGTEPERFGGCQNHYVDSPLFTDDGIPRYRLDGTSVVLRDDEAIESDRAEVVPVKSEIELMQEQIDDVILLMADMIGGI